MTDKTPVTEAGRRLLKSLEYGGDRGPTTTERRRDKHAILAIEAEARAEHWPEAYRNGRADALREATERVRALGTWDDPVAGPALDRAAVLAILAETDR